MNLGELLTRRTAQLAMSFFAAALILRCASPSRADQLARRANEGRPSLARRANRMRWSRWAWTLGCAVYLVHVYCAFQFVHHWSHNAAYQATARQTAEMSGLDWGGGLYLNYLFTLIWIGDVVWWWASRRAYEARPRWINWMVFGFMGFIAFNATVVFASGFSRWLGIAACAILGAIAMGPFIVSRWKRIAKR